MPAPIVAAPPPATDAADSEEEEPAPRPRRHRRKHRAREEEDEVTAQDVVAEEPQAPVAHSFRFSDVRFVVGVERVTSVLAWNDKLTQTGVQATSGQGSSANLTLESSGTTVSFLGGPATDGGRNPFGIGWSAPHPS